MDSLVCKHKQKKSLSLDNWVDSAHQLDYNNGKAM